MTKIKSSILITAVAATRNFRAMNPNCPDGDKLCKFESFRWYGLDLKTNDPSQILQSPI